MFNKPEEDFSFDSVPLLKEIIIVPSNKEKIPVSHENLAPVSQKIVHPRSGLYDEIIDCIKIIEESKKNLESYKTLQQRNQAISNLLNIGGFTLVMGPSGAALGLLLLMYAYTISKLNEKIQPLLPILSQAIQQRDSFNSWYSNTINELSSHLYRWWDFSNCIDNAFNAFKGFKTRYGYTLDFINACGQGDERICLRDNPEIDLLEEIKQCLDVTCQVVERYPVNDICHDEAMCNISKKAISCWNNLKTEDAKTQQSIDTFIAQHAAEKAENEWAVQAFQNKIQGYENQYSWDIPSTVNLAIILPEPTQQNREIHKLNK